MKSFRLARAGAVAGALAVVAALASPAHAIFGLQISPAADTLTWDAAIDPSTSAVVTYYIYKKFGVASNPLSGGTLVGTVTGKTSINLGGKMVGSNCWIIRSSDVVSGFFDTSVLACHSYLHKAACGNDPGVLRADANNTQLGFNQQWNFGYYLDDDSYVTFQVYPPNTTFITDAVTGLATPAGGSTPTKAVIDSTPRSGELASCSWVNTEIWDSRNSAGATVPNGLYFAYFTVYNPLLSPTTQYSGVTTIPVDIVRFTAFGTSGITPTTALGSVSYTLTGNGTVRILIAKPGRLFRIDSNGLVQSLDATGTVIDTSTNSVVKVLTFNRNAGTYAETWDGTDTLGVAVSTGIYSVGVSAVDAFNNRALDLSGNNGPIQGTIPVDRTPAQTALNTTPPTVTGVTVGGTAINIVAGGTTVGSFSSIAFALSANAGTGSNISVVTLTGPSGPIAGGNVTASGTTVTYSTTAVLSATGTYVVSIVAKDSNGNQTSQLSYNFLIPSSGSGSGGGSGGSTSTTQSSSSLAVKAYPNPAKGVGTATISFVLAQPSTVDIDIYTLTGRRLFHNEQYYASAGANTFPWKLSNDAGNVIASGIYLVRVKASNSLGTVSAFKKLMVIK